MTGLLTSGFCGPPLASGVADLLPEAFFFRRESHCEAKIRSIFSWAFGFSSEVATALAYSAMDFWIF